ncbi:hypothetical protein CR513_38643, partial [Mucuna pruriens]
MHLIVHMTLANLYLNSVFIMTNNNKTLKILTTPNITYQPLCIQYCELEISFELKFGLIYLLSKFHGLRNNHQKEDLWNKETLQKDIIRGMTLMDQNMADAYGGGTLMDKKPIATKNLVANMT